jgi:hypothetical protein
MKPLCEIAVSRRSGRMRPMKTIVSCFVFAVSQLCFAEGDANIIAMSGWSNRILLQNDNGHDIAICGRLLIVQGMEPAYGGPPTTNGAMTFVELRNASGGRIDVYFAVTNLHCELTDATGKAVPKPLGSGWSGRGPFSPSWVNLPYNSTIRLFANGGSMEPLMLYPGGDPWVYWSIPATDTNTYFLSGTLNVSTHTNLSLSPSFRETNYRQSRTATLEFPKFKISPGRLSTQRNVE